MEFAADKILVAVGRRPYTDGLGLEKVGIALDEKKRVKVDDHLRTSVPGVWAVGDRDGFELTLSRAEEKLARANGGAAAGEDAVFNR